MADKRIQDFETLEEAQDEDLILVSSNEDTYNMTVRTLNDKLIDETETDLDPRFQTIEAKLANTTIDPDDLGLYKDRDTGYIYPTYQGEASKNGLKLSLSTDDSTILSVVNTTGWQSKSVVSGGTCTLSVNWSSLKNNKSTGNGTLTVTVDNVAQTTKSVAQGDVSIDVASYLKSGINRVKLTITDASSNTSTVSYTVTLVELTIETTFDEKAVIATGETFDYAYSVTGELSKTVYFLINDKQIATAVIESSGRWHRQTIPALEVGSHTLKVYCTATVDGTTITSNTLTHALTIAESDVTSYVAELAEQAATSASNAATSEKNAKSSETAAKSSQTAAASSASAAKSSQTAAKTSETNAKTSETNAKTSEANAADSATLSESWAVGGTGTRTGEDTNNAKYYSEQASASKTAAATSATNAASSATAAAASAKEAENSAKMATGGITIIAPLQGSSPATAKDNNSIAIGSNADSRNYSTAIGSSAEADGESVAIGEDAKSDNYSTAIGSSAEATSGEDSIAIGHNANASGDGSIAIGGNTIASGNYQIIIGKTSSESSQEDVISIGNSNSIEPPQTIAIGNRAKILSSDSIAIGHDSYGTSQTITIGNNAKILSSDSIAIGHDSYGTSQTITIGNNAECKASNCVAIGFRSQATEQATVSFGNPANTYRLVNVTDPVNNNDAATKAYVDAVVASTITADRLEAIEEAIAELALMSIAEPDADTAEEAETNG